VSKEKEIKIHCKYDELVPIKKLKPHPKNPNEHDKDQIDRIIKIFKYQGVRKACVVSNQSGYMTTWHGRLLAAKELGMEKIPVVYQDYQNEEQEYADLIADNSIASWANINLSAVNFEIPNLGPDFDIEVLGLKDFAMDINEKEFKEKELDENIKTEKECPSCGYKW
jgi:hypothetical protein